MKPARSLRQLGVQLVLSVLSIILISGACSKSNTESDAALENATFGKIKTQAEPVAELAAGVAVATLSPQGSSVDPTTSEFHSKYASNIQQLRDSVCTTLKDSAKKASKEEADRLRATVNQALRDTFILKLLQAGSTAPPDRQAIVVQSLAIKSKSADGSPLTGSSAFKDASVTTAQGTIQIPSPGTVEYTKYTDWIQQNPSLMGFLDPLIQDYSKVVQDCA